jgi:hypothetical protein
MAVVHKLPAGLIVAVLAIDKCSSRNKHYVSKASVDISSYQSLHLL